jgi:hypothetical protein
MAGTREEGEGEKRFHSPAIYVYPVTEKEIKQLMGACKWLDNRE